MFKRTKKQIGDEGERLAENFLIENGYQILTKNFLCPHGEIDLIAKRKTELYFIEIRRRTNKRFGSAIESITLAKQKKIRKTAQYFLNKQTKSAYVPFLSVLTIDDEQTGFPKIEFLPDAFGY